MFNINTLVADAKQNSTDIENACTRYNTNSVSPLSIAISAKLEKAKAPNIEDVKFLRR